MAWITGVGTTSFGRLEGRGTLDLMACASDEALARADLKRVDVDGLLCGYSTTLPHLMLATLFAESYGLQPSYCHALQAGGATGFAMLMLAHRLVDAGQCRNILVVAGENRLSGQSRDAAIKTLAQVGHADYELPFGPTVPAYYALVASRYLHEFDVAPADLAELAVLMRGNAARHPRAHLRTPITVADVQASKMIASPLRLLDCCPVSDGAVALVVSRQARPVGVRVRGAGQAHLHQHVSQMRSVSAVGAGQAAQRAFQEAGLRASDIDYLAIYDSFTITLAILLEETGFAARAEAGVMARAGVFSPTGRLPLNTHGGLLSFGHCGVAGGMAHIAEAWLQLSGQADSRQLTRPPALAFVHGDGGVLSSHVSLVLERQR